MHMQHLQMYRKEGVKWLMTERWWKFVGISHPFLLFCDTILTCPPDRGRTLETENAGKLNASDSFSVSQHAEQPKAEGHARGRGSQTAAHTQRYSFMSFNYAVKSVSSSHEGKHLQGRCWLLYILKSQFIFVAVAHWPCRLSVNETNSWRNPLKSYFFALPIFDN